ncbi:MAG: hypothetical protein GAK45_00793 [Pseudomonas citronellolis]|nr:MAG: hypothetical protein GAK45_00793 [Pseudomonas citronellolis]
MVIASAEVAAAEADGVDQGQGRTAALVDAEGLAGVGRHGEHQVATAGHYRVALQLRFGMAHGAAQRTVAGADVIHAQTVDVGTDVQLGAIVGQGHAGAGGADADAGGAGGIQAAVGIQANGHQGPAGNQIDRMLADHHVGDAADATGIGQRLHFVEGAVGAHRVDQQAAAAGGHVGMAAVAGVGHFAGAGQVAVGQGLRAVAATVAVQLGGHVDIAVHGDAGDDAQGGGVAVVAEAVQADVHAAGGHAVVQRAVAHLVDQRGDIARRVFLRGVQGQGDGGLAAAHRHRVAVVVGRGVGVVRGHQGDAGAVDDQRLVGARAVDADGQGLQGLALVVEADADSAEQVHRLRHRGVVDVHAGLRGGSGHPRLGVGGGHGHLGGGGGSSGIQQDAGLQGQGPEVSRRKRTFAHGSARSEKGKGGWGAGQWISRTKLLSWCSSSTICPRRLLSADSLATKSAPV